MSTTIDEKVVSMQFDNSNFEKNVQKTLGTIDTLQKSLDFKNTGKAFKDLESAASGLNIDSSIVDSNSKITASFDAMSVFAVTALAKIANQAINTGTSLVKSLTVDQITAGWTKYGQKTESVQTLVNSTGKTVDEIDKYLQRLMWFSDETSYSFTEMTTALGSMTATGGNIDELIPMLMGMANATAYAGKGANEFSRVIYNLNQSYGQGYLSMMDWRSVQNAGVASQALMEQMIEAAKEIGTLDKLTAKTEKGTEVSVANFASTLSEKWATSEVMLKAFGKFSELTMAVEEAVSSGKFDTASEAIQALAGDYDQLAVRAFKSAQEAKSLSEAIDATKDAVSSGFMSTVEMIFGNYEESKTLWTDVANSLWDIFASGAEARNEILGTATDNKWAWEQLIETISGAGIDVEAFQSEMSSALSHAGYDVDDLTARYGSLGNAISHMDIPIALLQKVWKKFSKDTTRYTEDQIKELSNLPDFFGDTEAEVQNLFETLSTESGRFKIAESIINLLTALQTFANIVSHAISSVFGEIDSDMIYNLLDKVQSFTEWLIISGVETDEVTGEIIGLTGAAKDVADAFSGVFSIIKLVFDIVKSAGQAVGQILGAVFGDEDGNLLTFIGRIGAAVTNVVNFIEESEVISTIFSTIASVISGVVSTIWDFINVFRSSPAVVEFIERLSTNLSTLFSSINEWIQGIKTADNPISYILTGLVSGAGEIVKFGLDLITSLWDGLQQTIREKAGLAEDESVGGYIITGLINGIRDAIPALVSVVIDVGKAILDTIKDILGIHSPSTEAAELGKDLILGLWQGIQDGVNSILKDISTFISDVLMGLVNAFNAIDTDKILTTALALDSFAVLGGSIATVFVAVKNLTAPLKGIGDMFGGLGDMFEGIGDGIRNIGKGVKKYLAGAGFKKVADGIKGIAIGIALILGALFLLTLADYDELQKRVLILVEVMAAMVVMILIMKKVSSNSKNMSAALKALSSLGKLVILIAAAMYIIGKLSPSEAKQGMNAMFAIFGLLAAIVVIVGIMASELDPAEMTQATQSLYAIGNIVKGIGVAMILMAIAMKIVGKMETSEFVKGIIFVGLFAAFLAVLMIASQKGDAEKLKALGSILIGIAIVMVIMAVVMKLIGSMSWEELAKGVIGIAAMLGLIALFVWGMKKIDPRGDKIAQLAKPMLEFSIILLILAVILKMIGGMSWGELARGITGIAALMGLIAVFVWGMDEIDPKGYKIKSLMKPMLAFSAILFILAIVLKLIGGMSWGELARGVVGIAALMGLIAAFVWGMDEIDPKGYKIERLTKPMLAFSVILILLAVALKIIGSMSWDELAVGVVGLGLLMLFIMVFVKELGKHSGDMPKVAGTLIALGVGLILLAAALLIISDLSWDGLAKGLIGLGVLMLFIILFINSLKPMTNQVVPLLVTIGGIAVLMIALAAAILIVSKIPFKQAIAAVAAMAVLLLSVTAALFILSKTGAVSLKSIIAVAVIIVVVVAFAFLLKLIADIDTISAAANLILIGAFILAMTIVMAAVGLVAPLAASALVGLAGLALFVAALTGLLELLGQIADVEAINKAGDALYAIGRAIGRGIGGIIGGIGEGIASSLPAIADSISKFIETINSSAKNTPDVGALISVIKDVTGLSFGKKMDVTQFSEDLVSVAEGICTVAEKFNEKKDLLSDTSTIQNALAISEVLKNITEAIPQQGGLMSKLLGSKDMDSFGESIASYATSIGTFATTLSTYKDALSDTSLFEAARDAGIIMNELNEAIPKTGGIVQDILGESDLAEFGLKLVAYGISLGAFGTTLNMYKDVLSDPTLYEFARDVGLMMNEVNEAIPKTGGIVQDILGESDLAEFGLKLVAYGTSLGLFGTTLNMYHDILADQEMFQNAADVGLKMAALQEAIPKSGGWAQQILGKKDMGDFGESMAAFGDALYDFADSIKDVDFKLLNNAMPFITQIMDSVGSLAANMDKKDASSIDKIISDIGPMGEQLSKFSNNVTGLNLGAISNAVNYLNQFSDIAIKLGENGVALSELADGMKALANSGIDKFVSTINDSKEILKIEDAAKKMVSIFTDAASNNESLSKVSDVVKKLVDRFQSAIATNLTAIKYSGQNFVQGFVNGILSKTTTVYNAAFSIGRNAVIGVNRAINSKSPSKEAIKSGSYFGEGFVKGIDACTNSVYSSASSLGTSAINSLNNAIAGAKDLIENNVDSQPTIRPVLDLSEIQAGAGQIGNLLNASPYIFGGSSTAQSISRNFIGQNGRNYDVVSALDRLGSDIVNNSSGDSYVINGVTYEEGSDVAAAIQTLAHAAVISGRR